MNLGVYDLDSSTYTGDMTALIVEGDILNQIFGKISTPIDEVIYLPMQYPVNTWNPIRNIQNSIKNHSMDAVIDAIKEWRED